MKRLRALMVVSLAGLLWAGCGSSDPNAVQLRTGPEPEPNYCSYLSYGQGELIEDGRTGTAYKDEYAIHPLTWPIGFTARRSGETIEVLDTSGEVVAATGRTYQFRGPSWPEWTGGPGCLRELASFIPG